MASNGPRLLQTAWTVYISQHMVCMVIFGRLILPSYPVLFTVGLTMRGLVDVFDRSRPQSLRRMESFSYTLDLLFWAVLASYGIASALEACARALTKACTGQHTTEHRAYHMPVTISLMNTANRRTCISISSPDAHTAHHSIDNGSRSEPSETREHGRNPARTLSSGESMGGHVVTSTAAQSLAPAAPLNTDSDASSGAQNSNAANTLEEGETWPVWILIRVVGWPIIVVLHVLTCRHD